MSNDSYAPKTMREPSSKTRLTVELKVKEETVKGEPVYDLIARGVFPSWVDLRWWLSTHAVDDLDIDD